MRWLAKWAVFVLVGVLVLWFPITWFFFGSVHPCGILTQRMSSREKVYAHVQVMTEYWQRLNDSLRRGKELPPQLELGDREEEVIQRLRRDNYRLPPARCLWWAIRWRWNSQEDPNYQMLLKILHDEQKEGNELVERFTGGSERQRQRKTGKTALELLDEHLGKQ